MAVRLIAGRAGSGKTYACIEGVARELERSLVEGPRLILLVPEQAALQTERRILARIQSHAVTLGRCEVLSFRRLARRILDESTGPSPTPLTPRGRQMALRYLIARHRDELREFGQIAERSGFIAELSRGLAELFQENIGLEQLDDIARRAMDDDDAVAARLHDLALLYRAYLEYLGDDRVDPEGVLDLARARVAGADWLRGSRVWIDGFASLAAQQLRMIADLARTASHVEIALLLDPAHALTVSPSAASDALSLFSRTQTTWQRLMNTFAEEGVPAEPPLCLTPHRAPRFNAEPLARIEARLFSATSSQPRQIPGPAGQQPAECPVVRLVRAKDRRTEVDAAVRAILDLVQDGEHPFRYRDIGILVRDLGPYHDLLTASLARHRIPYFIDRRRPTFHHPLVQLVRSLLHIADRSDFQFAVAMLLKTGLAGASDADADLVENYALAHNLRWPAAWTRRWSRPPFPGSDPAGASEHARKALLHLDTLRRRLVSALGEWWPGHESISHVYSARDWAQRLYAALERLHVRATLEDWAARAESSGRLDEAAEHEQVWNEVLALLDELAAGLSDLPLSAAQFRDVIEAGLSEFTLGLVPATLDQVLVGGVERSRQPDLRAVFVLGFSDGQFPMRHAEDTILTDAERRYFEAHRAPLGRTRVQQMLDERMLAYVALTRASERLWISYPESDERGREILPSPYWKRLRRILPEIPEEDVGASGLADVATAADLAAALTAAVRARAMSDSNDTTQAADVIALYEWARIRAPASVRRAVGRALASLRRPADATLSAGTAALLWPAPHVTSVTRLESFAGCAYRHFVSHGLRLRERDRHELSPIHLGNLYHTILEEFVNELHATGTTLSDLSADEIHRRLDNIVDRSLLEYTERLNLDEAEQKRVRWRARTEVAAAIRAQQATIARTALRPQFMERKFGTGPDDLPALSLSTPAGREVLLRGKIDRVDVMDGPRGPLAVVYDYKRTQSRRLALDGVFHGLEQQLLAYLLVLKDVTDASGRRLLPGGAFYLPLLGPFARIEHPSAFDECSDKVFECYRPHGLLDFEHLDDLERGATGERVFRAERKKDNGISRFDQSTAVEHQDFLRLLEHVRGKMGELADQWLDGRIAVQPTLHRDELACKHCSLSAICRFEYVIHGVNRLTNFSRTGVIAELNGGGNSTS